VDSVAHTVAELNPLVSVETFNLRADAAFLNQQIPQVDVVVDCCDNFATRHAVNAACIRHGKPLVSGAAIRFDGQISVFDPRAEQAPCYACVFPPQQSLEETRCATMGVFAPLVGIIGCMQATEALKLLSGVGQSLAGRMLMLDARNMEWTEVQLPRDPNCPVCAAHFAL
jgi:molybdopterin/thiamine biosynthesis adenylyltransferase